MSMLRMLSPLRAGPSQSPARKTCCDIKLKLIVSGHGSIYMNVPDDPLWPHARSEGPRDDQLLQGVLDIRVPKGCQRRCKSVRVGLRTKARLNMGPERGWEEDTIFERKVEILGGNAEGMLLDEGVQRFEFTLIIPSSLAAHDWHHNGKVSHELFAEVEGQPAPSTSFSIFGNGRRSSTSTARGSATPGVASPRSPRSMSSSPIASPISLSPMLSAAASLSITRQEAVGFPLAPSYEQSQIDNAQSPTGIGSAGLGLSTSSGTGKMDKDDWIVGTKTASRNIMALHNPSKTGGASDLDERQSGFASGLGLWDLKIFSDVFSIGGPIRARLTLPSLSPQTTVFAWRLLLKQSHTVTSPRDDPETTKPIETHRFFTAIDRGQKPPKGVTNPGLDCPAMWRGTESGGTDDGELVVEGNAVMPKDDRARPTSLPGIVSPIKVSHTFVYEIFFSVWGEDDMGQSMAVPGPGGLRFLQVQRPVILPSCALIPCVLDLPEYCKAESNAPCPTCTKPVGEQLCLTCPPTIMPHPRHDHPRSLVGTKDGTCPTCSASIEVQRDLSHAWDLCACGAGIEELEARMKRFATEGLRTDFDLELIRAKEVAERSTRGQVGLGSVEAIEQDRGRSRSRSRSRGRGRGVGNVTGASRPVGQPIG